MGRRAASEVEEINEEKRWDVKQTKGKKENETRRLEGVTALVKLTVEN